LSKPSISLVKTTSGIISNVSSAIKPQVAIPVFLSSYLTGRNKFILSKEFSKFIILVL
jgi:hypothetical protein